MILRSVYMLLCLYITISNGFFQLSITRKLSIDSPIKNILKPSGFVKTTRCYNMPNEESGNSVRSHNLKPNSIPKDVAKSSNTKHSRKSRPLLWRLFGITVPLSSDPGKGLSNL